MNVSTEPYIANTEAGRRPLRRKALAAVAGVLLLSALLPAPFSALYWIRLALFKPVGWCPDGTATFNYRRTENENPCYGHEAPWRWQ